jgi:hypothetical protein
MSTPIALPPSSDGKEQRMQQRKQQRSRVKHEKTFQELMAEEAQRFKEAAATLPRGTAQELLLKRARQAETASHMSEWLSSRGLQPPT